MGDSMRPTTLDDPRSRTGGSMRVLLKLLFCVLWLLDTLFTSLLVARDGVEAEANPLVALAIIYHGLPGLWLVKALVLGLVLFGDWLYYKKENKRISQLVYLSSRRS